MSETIRLDVAAALTAFAPVRMVLGGVGARLEFSVEQLDDLLLAAENLFRAALVAEDLTRFGVEMHVDDGVLHLAAGPFTSTTLREQVKPSAPGAACLDLCRLLHATCDDVRLDEDDGSYRVVIVKGREAQA